MPQRGAPQFGPLCRMIGAGRGPSDRASFIQRGESERAKWCLPGGADLPWCAAAGAQLPGHWIRFGASLPQSAPGEARRTGCGASRAVRICHGAPQRGRNCPATGFDLEPLCRMVAAGRGPSDRAMWCLRADLPWCAAAGAQLPGHWIRFGASLPHDRRRERPVGPGQFHSERRIRAGRVVPPGRCGFAMVRRSGGATARPLDSIWSLSAAWSLSRSPGEARRTGPVSFREANQSGPCGASRAVRICHGAPQRGRNCPATGFDLEPLCRKIAIVKHWPNRRPTTKITDWN